MRCLLLAVLLLVAPPLAAQSVSGVLRQQESGAPIQGAVVALLNDAGAQRAGVLTDEAGRFRLVAPAPGIYRLRAERIGYASTLSPPLELTAGAELRQDLLASAAAIELSGIQVRGERRCTVRPEAGMGAAGLWEEARKALNAAAITEAQGLVRYQIRRYTRHLDPQTLRVRREESRLSSSYGERPFVSRPARELADSGYVRADRGDRVYFAPDAGVLLSDEFLDTHCFRVRREGGEEPHLIGLAFEPLRGRRLPDIRGVLWLDGRSGELRHVEFTYTNVPLPEPAANGGRVEYRRLPSGAWVVDRWWIRMPLLAREAGRGRVIVDAVRESGGEIALATATSGARVAEANRSALSGTVYDSIATAPLAGATVFLDGTSYSATTDSAGRFRIGDLPEGSYAVGFLHPRLKALGLLLPTRPMALARGDTVEIRLAIPSLTTALALACGEAARSRDHGVLVGVVRDPGTGRGLPDARVVVRSRDTNGLPRVFTAQTDRDGKFRFCQGPVGEAQIAAELLQRRSREQTIRLVASVPTRVDLAVSLAPPAATTGATRVLGDDAEAQVLGRVVDVHTGQPVAGAVVSLGDAHQGVLTGAGGDFRIARAVAGPHVLTVRHLGYASHPQAVQLAAGVNRLEVQLAARAVEVEGLNVTVRATAEGPDVARPTARHALSAGELRDMGRRGTRLADAVLARFPVRTKIVFPPTPGVCIEGGRGASTIFNGNTQESTGPSCDMIDVYLDGVHVADPGILLSNMTLEDVQRMEYLTPLEAGVRYGSGRGSGVLLIYTRP